MHATHLLQDSRRKGRRVLHQNGHVVAPKNPASLATRYSGVVARAGERGSRQGVVTGNEVPVVSEGSVYLLCNKTAVILSARADHASIETRNHLWHLPAFGEKHTYVCRTPGYKPTAGNLLVLLHRRTVHCPSVQVSDLAACVLSTVRPYCRVVAAAGSPAIIVYFLLQCSHNFMPDCCTTQSLSQGVHFWSAAGGRQLTGCKLPQPCKGKSLAQRDSASSLTLCVAEQAGT